MIIKTGPNSVEFKFADANSGVEYATSLLPEELKTRLEVFLAKHNEYNLQMVTEGDALVEYAKHTYSTKVTTLLETIMGISSLPMLQKHLADGLEKAVADMS